MRGLSAFLVAYLLVEGFTKILAAAEFLPPPVAEELAAEVGERVTVMPDKHQGLRAFPDEPIGIISRRPYRFTMVAGTTTFLMEGDALESALPVKKVLEPTGKADDFDCDYAGIGSIYVVEKPKAILGFYHGERHRKQTVSYTGGNKWYGTIGLATSKDHGRTFIRQGAIITASTPFDPNSSLTSQGVGDPCVLLDPTGKFLYAYYTDHIRANGRSVVTCMARSRIEDQGRPGSWKKFFDGAFDSDGIGGRDTPVADLYGPSVTYVPALKKFIMVGNREGIQWCHSDDGIHWSKNQQLVLDGHAVPLPNQPVSMRPHLLLQNGDAKSVKGLLLYSHSPRWGGDESQQMHYFVKRPVTFKTAGTPKEGGPDIRNRLAGTKWINTNKVTFEWTADGRFLHKGIQREWRAPQGRTVEVVFGPKHVDRLEFNEDFTEFKQLIGGGPNFFEGKPIAPSK